jgi:hypothetical protein
VLRHPSSDAGGLAARPLERFRADDGKDPVQYPNQAAGIPTEAHYGKLGLNISESHDASRTWAPDDRARDRRPSALEANEVTHPQMVNARR